MRVNPPRIVAGAAVLMLAALLGVGIAHLFIVPAMAQFGPGKYPVVIRPTQVSQQALKVDTSTTPNRVEIGCETDQLGGAANQGLRITGSTTGVTLLGVPCTGAAVDVPITITAGGASAVTITGGASVSGPTGSFTNTTNQIALGASPNTTTISAPVPAGAITLTLPSKTDTLVGRSSVDTLTNKNVSGPVITATQLLGSLGTLGSSPLYLGNGDTFIGQNQAKGGLGPGVPGITLRVRGGSSPGTCKLVAVGGSATTEQTIVDNVGSGCQ